MNKIESLIEQEHRKLVKKLDPAALEDYILSLVNERISVLSADESLRFLFHLDARLYALQGQEAVRYGNGTHPKHKHMNYHDFFVNRIHKNEHVLDIGCGGGFLANDLAARGFQVVGIDASVESLRIAQERDETRSVQYQVEDAYQVSFDANTFDVVCAMDFLEHVQYPDQVILEASRVLKPGGCFFFHTFNRNLISGLLAIRCVEWFVKNTPKDLHLLRYFIKPSEIVTACKAAGMNVIEMRGVTPQLFSWSVLKGLVTGRVPKDFKFRFSSSLFIGYCGFAKKNGDQGFKLD